MINLSKKLKISKDQIIETHLNKEYFCYMTGFIAGMPFIGDINKNIRVDRLKTPRVKVPRGSVELQSNFVIFILLKALADGILLAILL